MAFSHGNESASGVLGGSYKKFVGAASVKVLALNPTVDEWNKITGGNSTEEKVYIGEKDGVKFAKVTFLVEVDAERSLDKQGGIVPLTFWLRRQTIKGQQSGKVKIIDRFGQTAWATEEELAAKKIPQYANGPANIDADFRACIAGEEELTKFLKALMCIPNARVYNSKTGAWEANPKLEDCQARLDEVKKYFEGDFSEIRKIIKSFPDNKARVLFGVKNADGKEYQDFLTTMFLTNGNPNNVAFQKELKNALEIGKYANTYFGEKDVTGVPQILDVREYTVESSSYQDAGSDIPPVTTEATPGMEEPESDLPF